MPFADYTDGTNTVKAIRWDGTETVADEVVYQMPGISVHLNAVGETSINELRFGVFLTIPEGDWVVISIAESSVQASRMTHADFTASYTLV